MKHFHERNFHVLDSDINCTFEELLDMDMPTFKKWVKRMRDTIKESWDNYDCPCVSGVAEDKMIKDFDKLSSYPVFKFAQSGDDTPDEIDIVDNHSHAGTAVNQFFPTMMKVPIVYSLTNPGYSIYDLFNDEKYQVSVEKRCLRHFRKDGFYHYSATLKKNDKKNGVIPAKSALEWLDIYLNNKSLFKGYDFWVSETKGDEGISTGYNQVDTGNLLGFTANQLKVNLDKFTPRQLANVNFNELKEECRYDIRFYKLGQKIFPAGFKSFKLGYCQAVANFPPATAKYLYERYTEHCKTEQDVLHILDPSSGWGGRILGAMTVKDDRVVHYIGNDPNMDNWIESDDEWNGKSRYEYLANFVNTKTGRSNPFFSHANTYEIFCGGSEDLADKLEFQKYKGKLDFVFTSPPYFNKESYSQDEHQSCVKYGDSYESWRDGFLEPTIKTICEYLKNDRYCAWNIADVKYGDLLLPLEEDSKKFFEKYGMNYVRTEKMLLASAPGSNRIDKDGNVTCKNGVMYQGKMRKYEPIFIYYKK